MAKMDGVNKRRSRSLNHAQMCELEAALTDPDADLKLLAKRFGVSLRTIQRYRRGFDEREGRSAPLKKACRAQQAGLKALDAVRPGAEKRGRVSKPPADCEVVRVSGAEAHGIDISAIMTSTEAITAEAVSVELMRGLLVMKVLLHDILADRVELSLRERAEVAYRIQQMNTETLKTLCFTQPPGDVSVNGVASNRDISQAAERLMQRIERGVRGGGADGDADGMEDILDVIDGGDGDG